MSNTRELVEKYQFRFTKSLGQNFLVDQNIVRDIVKGAGVTKEDYVIEIGPGVGTLTRELLKEAASVTAIELDDKLLPILKEELKDYENFHLIHGDATKVQLDAVYPGKEIKLVANLPYYVTTPIITKILNDKVAFSSLTIMIQKEVAERMDAVPGTKDYGSLSVLVQYYCDTKIVRNVPPESFMPRPKVDSTVIRLTKLEKPRAYVKDEELFFKIVRMVFTMRRKTLSNNLKSMGYTREFIEEVLEAAGIDLKARGETLSVEKFAELSNVIKERVK
ncbi:16S rRNA (adenine(1518)-N(6)/adenine(1519)-N(6))-dimethyltransferase RsmA [Proteiniclasticum ruminis]|jgi:16S rRNA (adenine1518-N6/adenine1519-N6)-dimethyltransferase|uniref:Ribosomal RNA small subunit methyltransferase A n=1 Tax=Proteiniclasticum ruminis TaxID=398199 RepID=A0A1I5APL9_9CLOT|nr:16S rRNA (adenine(1518)-N(6)/adenine(1519)-N(6))-dimethyltransferase RsmA [Proteiniclasticum ruminis]SFN64119.1 16S rRNA (adenine1518-N6/adenine1519-N6)-dimethyltransferase [Proteiniclasticum ruminis]